MNTFFNIEKASEYFWSNYTKEQSINDILVNLCPINRKQAYEIQSNYRIHTGYSSYGWKIAATSKAGQKHIGVTAPIAGRLFKEKVYKNNSEVILGLNKMAVAEPEFSFKIKKAIVPRTKPYLKNEIIETIGSLYPSIEIPNSRFNKYKVVGEENLIADNACAHLYVLGEKAPSLWKNINLSKHSVKIFNLDGAIENGTGANVLEDPLIALTWLANELSNYNITIEKDMVISTGTCSKPLPIKINDIVIADFGCLGQVKVHIK